MTELLGENEGAYTPLFINDFEFIVGQAYTEGYDKVVIWEKGSLVSQDLSDLSGQSPESIKWTIGLDNRGKIVLLAPKGWAIIAPTADSLARLANVSTRSLAGAGSSTQIAGLIVGGSSARKILLRAGGPYLEQFGVTDVLADPVLTLYENNVAIASNDDWGTLQDEVSPAVQKAGAVPFVTGSKDAALIAMLKPNVSYTAQVTGKNGATGNAIVEAYDVDDVPDSSLINISTRSFVGTDGHIQIAGFILRGEAPRKVLIRAAGPYLSQFGVTNVLADPELHVFRGATEIASNDDWSSNGADVADAVHALNGVSFADGSRDAAIVVILEPNQPYTAQVSGKNGTSGNALIEVYALP